MEAPYVTGCSKGEEEHSVLQGSSLSLGNKQLEGSF